MYIRYKCLNCKNDFEKEQKYVPICPFCNSDNIQRHKSINECTPEEWNKASEAVRSETNQPLLIDNTIYIADVCCDKARMIAYNRSVVIMCPNHAVKIIR